MLGCLASVCSWHLEGHSPAGAEPGPAGSCCMCSISHCFTGQCCWLCRNVLTAIETKQNKNPRTGGKSNNTSNQRNMLGAALFSMVTSLSMNHKKLSVSSAILRCSKTPTPAAVQLAAPRDEWHTVVCFNGLTPEHRCHCCWSCYKAETVRLA